MDALIFSGALYGIGQIVAFVLLALAFPLLWIYSKAKQRRDYLERYDESDRERHKRMQDRIDRM